MAQTLRPIAIGTPVTTVNNQTGVLEKMDGGTALVRVSSVFSVRIDARAIAPSAELDTEPVKATHPGVDVHKFTEAAIAWQRKLWIASAGGFTDTFRTKTEALAAASTMLAVDAWHNEAAA